MDKAVDCDTPLTAASAKAFKDAGVVAVARYLGKKTQGWAKALTLEEVDACRGVALPIVPIWEGDPTYLTYFTASQGWRDARDAIIDAKFLGIPHGTVIYFTVDCDVLATDIDAVLTYFEAVHSVLGNTYSLGVYGSARVVQALHDSHIKPDFYWQTAAWSGGQILPWVHLYQRPTGETIGGVQVDIDEVFHPPGWWSFDIAHTPENVLQIQRDLNAALGTHIIENGQLDAVTHGAVKSFQQLHRLPITGALDPATLAMLHQVLQQMAKQKTAAVQATHAQNVARVQGLLTEAQRLLDTMKQEG